jgi:ATP-dependent helicase Lhr and Lhr-like helicase
VKSAPTFHPVVSRWFERRFGTPTEPQCRGWPAILSGESALIAAPTGTGKTLAAFLAALNQLFCEGLEGDLRDETTVVYISPLKALSNDIHKNLEEPLAELRAAFLAEHGRDIEVRSAVRTGDTLAAGRRAIISKPPHILVTTPESLYLMLTSASVSVYPQHRSLSRKWPGFWSARAASIRTATREPRSSTADMPGRWTCL